MIFGFLLGGLIGYLFGGGSGLLIGGLIGYFSIRPLLRVALGAQVRRVQRRFLDSAFAVMGAVCKADGQVSENEIRVAEALFDRLRLDEQARSSARAAFNRGKSPDFDLDREVALFAQASRGHRALHAMFLQTQLAAIAADGEVHPAEHEMLLRIARGLGLSEEEVRRMEAAMRGGAGAGRPRDTAAELESAYATLGLSPDASDDAVRKAYRKLIHEHHPDRLAAKGLPESMRPMAEERSREITTAYDCIKTARATT